MGRQCVSVLTGIIISWQYMWYSYVHMCICVSLYANLYIFKMIYLWRLKDSFEYCSFPFIKMYFLFTVLYSFLTNAWNAATFPVSVFSLCLLVLGLQTQATILSFISCLTFKLSFSGCIAHAFPNVPSCQHLIPYLLIKIILFGLSAFCCCTLMI